MSNESRPKELVSVETSMGIMENPKDEIVVAATKEAEAAARRFRDDGFTWMMGDIGTSVVYTKTDEATFVVAENLEVQRGQTVMTARRITGKYNVDGMPVQIRAEIKGKSDDFKYGVDIGGTAIAEWDVDTYPNEDTFHPQGIEFPTGLVKRMLNDFSRSEVDTERIATVKGSDDFKEATWNKPGK